MLKNQDQMTEHQEKESLQIAQKASIQARSVNASLAIGVAAMVYFAAVSSPFAVLGAALGVVGLSLYQLYVTRKNAEHLVQDHEVALQIFAEAVKDIQSQKQAFIMPEHDMRHASPPRPVAVEVHEAAEAQESVSVIRVTHPHASSMVH